MSESLTYHDALTILGAPKSRVVSLLDAVASGGLTIWAAAAWTSGKDITPPISLLELKNEIVQYGHVVVRRVSEWRSGLSRFDRSQRLVAAHAVLVISSYFEALGNADLPVPIDRLGFTGAEQVALAAGGEVPGDYVAMIELLLREPLPMPEPHCSYEEVRGRLRNCYVRLSGRLSSFVSGLSVWDELDDGRRQRLLAVVRDLPRVALEAYDTGYRSLAAENREFLVWAGLAELHAIGTGLAGVESLLNEMAVRRPGDRPLAHLMRSYRAALDEPIVGASQTSDGVVFPLLGQAYLNPVCRVAEVGAGDAPAAAEWWQGQKVVSDIETFLAGYLTSPRAAQSPLVVLGEPGCGKSKLTEVLAARLAEHDFLPVRVELRNVAAESMILEQIEQAIYRGPGERVSWHDLLDASGDAQPVVLLDGFDELVQATAINRYDYLEQVRDFQHSQAQIGHPVAAIVTSRTIMADHARFPAGSLALQIQPFSEDQVRRWLDIWGRCNSAALTERSLRPLPADTALQHRELATQPLLLMMLAIFDATGNAIQRTSGHLSRAELYEGLFTDFALREVRKSASNRSLPLERLRELAERELQRLAIVALAMFARGRQAATEAELNRDLPVLFPEDIDPGTEVAALSAAQRATGRFFFIHKSEARSHDERARSYEFLHSTFGEFLVARLTASALRDLATMREVLRHGVTAGAIPLDDGFLHAVLSFSCLASRAPIIEFVRDLFGQISADEAVSCQEILSTLLAGSLYPHPSRSFQDYEPVRHPVPRRLAAYSANLVVCLVLLAGPVNGSDLFGSAVVAARWREYGYLWHGMFTTAEWRGMISTIRARVSRANGPVDIRLVIEDGSPVSPTDSIVVGPGGPWHDAGAFDVLVSADNQVSYDVEIPASSYAGRAFRDAAFTPNWHNSLVLLQAIPFIRAAGGDVRRENDEDNRILPGYLLAHLDYTREHGVEDRAEFYIHCMIMMAVYPELREQLLLRLREDAWKFSPDKVLAILRNANVTAPTESYVALINDLWWRLEDTKSRGATVGLLAEICASWPEVTRMGIDRHLISAMKAAQEEGKFGRPVP